MRNIKLYIVKLTENVSDKIKADFGESGVKAIWVSEFLPHILVAETTKTKEELEQFPLVKRVDENAMGSFDV